MSFPFQRKHLSISFLNWKGDDHWKSFNLHGKKLSDSFVWCECKCLIYFHPALHSLKYHLLFPESKVYAALPQYEQFQLYDFSEWLHIWFMKMLQFYPCFAHCNFNVSLSHGSVFSARPHPTRRVTKNCGTGRASYLSITVKGLISRSLAFHKKEMSALTLPPGRSVSRR